MSSSLSFHRSMRVWVRWRWKVVNAGQDTAFAHLLSGILWISMSAQSLGQSIAREWNLLHGKDYDVLHTITIVHRYLKNLKAKWMIDRSESGSHLLLYQGKISMIDTVTVQKHNYAGMFPIFWKVLFSVCFVYSAGVVLFLFLFKIETSCTTELK